MASSSSNVSEEIPVFPDLWNKLKPSSSADFTFALADGSTIRAHKAVLAATTGYFRALFDSEMADSSSDSMVLSESMISTTDLRSFLQFLYTRSFEIQPKRLTGIYQLGMFFGVPSFCGAILKKVSSDQILQIAEIFAFHGMCDGSPPREFVSMVATFISSVPEKELKGLSEDAAGALLQTASHCNELWGIHTFKFLAKWARANGIKKNPEISRFVCFEKMWPMEFQQIVAVSGLFPRDVLTELRKRVILHRDLSFLPGMPNPSLSLSHQFGWPYSVAVHPDKPKIFISDRREHKVQVFDSLSGKLVDSFGGPGKLQSPMGIAISEYGMIFVGDLHEERLQALNEQNGSCLFSNEIYDQCLNMDGLCIDRASNRIHVACNARKSIFVFSGENGNILGRYGQSHLDRPVDVAIDSSRGISYAVDFTHGRVVKFKTSGEFLGHFGEGFLTAGCQKSVAVDEHSGHVVVADFGSIQAYVFTSDGALVQEFGSKRKGGEDIKKFFGLAVGHEGQIYVCCETNKGHFRVLVF